MKVITKMEKVSKIGLGGGCHWCTEGVFQSLIGVSHVDQGWISSAGINDSYSEGIIVSYNAEIIPLAILIEIHLLTHSSTSNHTMRDKYRSAIYVYSSSKKAEINEIIQHLKAKFSKPIITQTLYLEGFKRNEEQFLNYYKNQPEAPFCKSYIEPKIQQLIKTHNKYLFTNKKPSSTQIV